MYESIHVHSTLNLHEKAKKQRAKNSKKAKMQKTQKSKKSIKEKKTKSRNQKKKQSVGKKHPKKNIPPGGYVELLVPLVKCEKC